MKKIIILVLLIILGIFIYLKIQVMGNPNSSFNQTTRFTFGKYPFMRTLLGLHKAGDARGEYLRNQGDVLIEWFKPESEDVDISVLDKLAAEVKKYTGRQANVVYGGPVDDTTLSLSNLNAFGYKARVQKTSGSTVLSVFFTSDYSPRPDGEFSTTYLDSGLVIPLSANRRAAMDSGMPLDSYLSLGLLREFGRQIGLEPNNGDDCILNNSIEIYNAIELTDFCELEQNQISQFKQQFSN